MWTTDKPDPKLKRILVISSATGNIHVLHYDYDDWLLSETDTDFPGCAILFIYWMELPLKPREKKSMDLQGHFWSGWPGAFCLYCGQSDPMELEVAGLNEEEIAPYRRECPENKLII